MTRTRLPAGPLEADVDGLAHGGDGVARVEGKAVFVPGALPGERVRLEVVDDRKRFARARLLEVLDPSDDRVEPPCPLAPRPGRDGCGGCDLQHAAPAAQRRLKTRVVIEQLERIGGLDAPPVADCRPVGPDLGYRTHARLHADADGRLGFHRAGTREVVPVAECPQLTPAAQALRAAVGDATGAEEVVVRAHASTGAAVAVLTPGAGPLDAPDLGGLEDAGLSADLLLTQPDGSTLALRGDGILAELVDGREHRFDASTFFQVSPQGAQALVDEVRAAVDPRPGDEVWDCYAGVGLLSLPLAAAGARVTAVEGHAAAVGWLRENARAAGLEVAAKRAPVAGWLADVSADREPAAVVLDPPRTGAGPAVTDRLLAIAPRRIVYVACDPAALARDAAALTAGGYRLVSAQPLDLFPMTHHVEVVAVLERP